MKSINKRLMKIKYKNKTWTLQREREQARKWS
jgi:hypothetical protein